MRYFARANVPHLPKGEWTEIPELKYEILQKIAKSKTQNFNKAGIEALVMKDKVYAETYRYVYPELYTMLCELAKKDPNIVVAEIVNAAELSYTTFNTTREGGMETLPGS